MQANPKKVKALIFLCIIVLVTLIAISITLIVKINIANKNLIEQQKQISQLEQIIENYNNPPSNNNQTITPGGN